MQAMEKAAPLAKRDLVSSDQIELVRQHLTRADGDPVFSRVVAVRIALAFERTREAKKRKPDAANKKLSRYRRLALALRKVEILGRSCLREDFQEELTRQREDCEELIGELGRRVRRSGGARNLGRETAVREAFFLLVHFGDPPTKTWDRAWHKVANTLYGGDDVWATLENFERPPPDSPAF